MLELWERGRGEGEGERESVLQEEYEGGEREKVLQVARE